MSEGGGAGPGPGALLKDRSIKTRFDLAQAMRWARQEHGIGLARQTRQMLGLALRGWRLTPREYFEYALFRRGISDADRRSYVGTGSQRRLNLQLSPLRLQGLHGLMTDKVLCALVLQGAGIATLPTLALFSRAKSVPRLRCLDTPEALADWLLREAPLPVFGKPLDGSLGLGAVSIVGRDGSDLIFGDGRRASAAALAAEVARDYAAGWLVQPLLRLHPELAEIAGTAAAMLRLVTLRDAAGPAALYAVLRLPARDAMIDTNQHHAANGNVVVDLETGALGRAQSMWRMNTSALETSTATGVALAGRRLPFLPETRALCEAVHRMFPDHGVLGFDVGLTAEGPVIGEVNGLPHHHNWQRAADRGLMNPDFAPRIAAAIAETEWRVAVSTAELARFAGHRTGRAVAPPAPRP